MDDFKYTYFQKCAELRVPPNLAIINLIRHESFGENSPKTLNLDNVGLVDQDIAPLVSALEGCTDIKSLVLSRNQIKDLSVFERLFQVNTTLEGIDLSENPFSEEAGRRLVTLLSTKTHIKWFNITKIDTERKQGSALHKKGGSICIQKASSGIPLPISGFHQRIPMPHKPRNTGGHKTFRTNLYQGPNSARTLPPREEHEEEEHVKIDELSHRRLEEKDEKEEKEEMEGKNEQDHSGAVDSNENKKLLMSRTEWILRMKDIFSKLVNEFEETLFHKALIIKRVREESKSFPFVNEEGLCFDKGYSMDQVLEALEASEEYYLRYDDIIEIICNLDKQKTGGHKDMPVTSINSTTDSNVNLHKNYPEPSASSFETHNPSLFHTSPIQHIPTGLDYVECSFSIDNQGLSDIKDISLKDASNNAKRKPPKFVSKTRVNSIAKQPDSINSPSRADYSHSTNFEMRNHPNSSSPTEIETARFNKDSNQESGAKDKADSFKLEISSEISHLHEIEGQGNESLSFDVESALNGLNTTAKIMSAFGETPNNLSSLNTYNFLLDKLAVDTNMTSFTISDKTPQSSFLQGTIKQLFGNRFFQHQESEPLTKHLSSTNTSVGKGTTVVYNKKENGNAQQIPSSSISENTKAAKPIQLETNDKKGDREKKEYKTSLSLQEASKVKDSIEDKQGKPGNISEFEKVLESIEATMVTKPNQESLEILKIIDSFQIHRDSQHPMVSFSYNSSEAEGEIPVNNLTFKNMMKHIEAVKLVHTNNIGLKLTDMLSVQLKILNLSSSNLTQADFLSSFKNLEFLNLSNNKLKSLPTIGNCTKLREVHLASNQFAQLPNFFGLEDIFLISAPFNLISALEHIANLTLNRKLQYLDLRGNPVSNKPNYAGLVMNILPRLKGIDVNAIEYSQFKIYENICFTKTVVQATKSNPAQQSNSNILSKPVERIPLSTLQEYENDNRGDMNKIGHDSSHVSMVLSESDKSEDLSMSITKRVKNHIPKLNIENIQPLDIMSLNSTGPTQKKHHRVGIRFQNPFEPQKGNRLVTERPQSSNHSPTHRLDANYQFRRRVDTGSNRFNMNFLSQREPISANQFGNHMRNSSGTTLYIRSLARPAEKQLEDIEEKRGQKISATRLSDRLLEEERKEKKKRLYAKNRYSSIETDYGMLTEKLDTRNKEGLKLN